MIPADLLQGARVLPDEGARARLPPGVPLAHRCGELPAVVGRGAETTSALVPPEREALRVPTHADGGTVLRGDRHDLRRRIDPLEQHAQAGREDGRGGTLPGGLHDPTARHEGGTPVLHAVPLAALEAVPEGVADDPVRTRETPGREGDVTRTGLRPRVGQSGVDVNPSLAPEPPEPPVHVLAETLELLGDHLIDSHQHDQARLRPGHGLGGRRGGFLGRRERGREKEERREEHRRAGRGAERPARLGQGDSGLRERLAPPPDLAPARAGNP